VPAHAMHLSTMRACCGLVLQAAPPRINSNSSVASGLHTAYTAPKSSNATRWTLLSVFAGGTGLRHATSSAIKFSLHRSLVVCDFSLLNEPAVDYNCSDCDLFPP
jgi:hypothetical protein